MSGTFAVAPPLTLHRTLGAGDVVGHGTMRAYQRVAALDGESHLVREDLVAGAAGAWRTADRRPLLCLAHITDLQLADVQSPVRFEFLNREYADPRFADLIPVQRPQEALTPHAVEAMLNTLNRIDAGPATGAPLDLAITTGDAIDNAQWNELTNFLALMDGGLVRFATGRGYEGVQQRDWPDDVFWRPDGDGPSGPDIFRTLHGFPHHPGVLEHALADFRAGGLRIPWLACFGNHEALIQGVGTLTPQLATALVGGRKPVGLPGGTDRDRALETFITGAHAFLDGEQRTITPDPARRPVSRRDFVQAHLRAGARPDGHGFTQGNVREATAYYCYDTPDVRLIALDTTRTSGGADGGIDVDQLRWLGDRLVEVHSAYRRPDGEVVRSGNEDRLVVLFSHHGLDTLTNRRGVGVDGSDGADVVGAPEVADLLHRFPNVVLWLNGHTHTNGVRARRAPGGSDLGGGVGGVGGFWEVTTSAVVDWPCQTRIVELLDAGDGRLAVVATMVDHDSPIVPPTVWSERPEDPVGPQLASLHRELAANVPWAGAASSLAGTPADRNVVLLMPAPFALRRTR